MPDLTLESLSKRIEAIEHALRITPEAGPAGSWQRVVGMCTDSEFMRQVDAEGRAIREAERAEAARVDKEL
jgi:hypothetical protein